MRMHVHVHVHAHARTHARTHARRRARGPAAPMHLTGINIFAVVAVVTLLVAAGGTTLATVVKPAAPMLGWSSWSPPGAGLEVLYMYTYTVHLQTQYF